MRYLLLMRLSMKHTSTREITKPLIKLKVINIVFVLACIPIDILSARLMSKLVDSAIASNLHGVIFNGSMYLIVFLAAVLAKFVFQVNFSKMYTVCKHKCKIIFYKLLYDLPLYKLFMFEEGRLKESIDDDLSSTLNRVVFYYPNIISHATSTIIYSAYIAKYSFVSSITLVIIGILQIIPPITTKLYFEKNYADTRDVEAKITNLILESYRGFSVIKLFNLNVWFLSRISVIHNKYKKVGVKGIKTTATENTISNLISTIIKYGTYALFGLLVFYNIIDRSLGITIIALSTKMYASMMLLFSSLTGIFVSKQAEKRLEDLFKTNSKDTDLGTTINSRLVLNNISISFDGKTIVKNYSHIFPKSGICLIKGRNGCGKTTLLRLLTGLICPSKGNVELNDVNIYNLKAREVVKVFSYLPQEDIKLGITVRDLFCSIENPESQKYAVITSKEFGLDIDSICDTQIYNLSGGERKKVFLSFILAQNNKIVFLDEPTNSLDDDGINILVNKLKDLDALVFVVTHDNYFDEISDYTYHMLEGDIQIEKKDKV